MGTFWPKEKCKQLSNKLVKGREWAIQLRKILQKPQQISDHEEDDGSVGSTTVDLAVKIFTSFTEILSVLNSNSYNSNSNSNSNSAHPDHHESTGGEWVSHLDNSYWDERSLEDSGESHKKVRSIIRDRRGCYKRRKNSQSWKTITSTIDDGQTWRKYGQKNILNSPYPRSYFRCSRKYDEGCKANKQVQQIQETPQILYEIIYIGEHSCRNILKKSTVPQLMILNESDDNSRMIFTTSDQTRIANYEEDTKQLMKSPSSTESVIKKDMSINTKEEIISAPSDHLSENYLSSMNNNYMSWTELEALEPTIFKSFPKMVSENEDVVCREIIGNSDGNLGNMDFVDNKSNADFCFDEPDQFL